VYCVFISFCIQVDRITLSGRDGEWFRKTWETYIRPKFRKALGKWFSETGGGDGTIQSFQNFCGNEKWLCSIYMLDAENGFLLASNSNPKVPAELDNESGFYKDGAVPTTPEKSNATNKSKIQSMIDKTDKQLEGFATLQDTIVKMLESRTNPALAAAAPAAVVSAAKERTVTDILAEQRALKQDEAEVDNDPIYTPNSKKKVKKRIRKRRLDLIDEVKRLDFDNDSSSEESSQIH
jgi:hypothetical protein